jgi:hypothetical protein
MFILGHPGYRHEIHGDWCRGPQVPTTTTTTSRGVVDKSVVPFCGQPSIILVSTLIQTVGFHLIDLPLKGIDQLEKRRVVSGIIR